MKQLLALLPQELAKKCLENFKANQVDIKLFTNNGTDFILENGDAFKTKKDLCTKSDKKICTCIETKNYEIDNQTKQEYLKYLFSHQVKDNPTICIERTLYYLAVTLFMILGMAIFIDMINNFSHKRLIYFVTVIMIFLPTNYILIKKFYKHLYTTYCEYKGISTYEKKDGQWNLIHYSQNNVDFGKLYTYYVGGYFVIISTFTFYCSSLMHVGH